MNLAALEKVNWFVSHFWGKSANQYLKSIGLECDPEKPFFDFLKELDARGDEQSIVTIINMIFMDTYFRNLYRSGWNFYGVRVCDVADDLIELLQMEGYKVEDFKVQVEKSPLVRPNVKLVDDIFITDKFYLDLVNEINGAYRCGLPSATWILLRKIFENLLIDSLRTKYGTADLNLFYWKQRRRFHDFSKLLSNFKDNLPDFLPYSSALNSKVITMLERFKEFGDSHAHSIEVLPTTESIEKQKEEVNYLIHLLYELVSKIKSDKT